MVMDHRSYKIVAVVVLCMLLLGLGYVRSVRLRKKRVTLVVARYREDVRWLRAFDKDRFDIVCYNKGEPVVDLPAHIVQTRLPNVGREAHTYLYHILRTYKNPTTEYVVFLQGHPFDHLHNKNVKELISTIDNHVARSPPSSAILFIYNHEPVDMFPELHMKKYMDYFGFRGKRQNTITYTPGAQFIIHRNDIVKNPMALYQELFAYSSHDYHNQHPPRRPFVVSEITAYTIERLWLYIFGLIV